MAMIEKSKRAFQQMIYFAADYKRLAGSKKLRMVYLWLSRVSVGVLVYRFERMMFLLFGKFWQLIRILLIPILYPLQAYSNIDIGYKADIGPGILVLHPSVGIVISGFATIGKNITLTGGNVIGGRPEVRSVKLFRLGDNLNLGANAVILGPVNLGDNIIVGASAMVNQNFESNCTLVGVPAKKSK